MNLKLVFTLAVFLSSVAAYDPTNKIHSQLESLLQRFEESEQKWEKIVIHQEKEITQLRDEIQHQNSLLAALQHPIARNVRTPSTGARASGRTCEELRTADTTLPSGNYSIDPDGSGGDDPITVYCDMTTGTTSVGHNSEDPIRISACSAPGCYNRPIVYNGEARQLEILARLSDTCQQYIKFNCLGVPFEFNGVTYAYWNDRQGENRTFWAGPVTDIHTCQCGIEGNCGDPSVKCNCDALAPEATFDEGYVTEKDLLPVTGLNFGRSNAGSALGIHTLGKLECKGRAVLTGPPASCTDLWQVGYVLNGIYTVKSGEEIKVVYCDFSKLPGEEGQEIPFGPADVKTKAVYFNGQKSAPFTSGQTLTYNPNGLNVGEAMNFATGIFTAPAAGTYFFAFSAPDLPVELKVAGVTKATGTGSLTATLNLTSGEEVGINTTGPGTTGQANFNGLLLKENLAS